MEHYLIKKGELVCGVFEGKRWQDAFLRYADGVYTRETRTCLLCSPDGICELQTMYLLGSVPDDGLGWEPLISQRRAPKGWPLEPEGHWYGNDVNMYELFVPVVLEEEVILLDRAKKLDHSTWEVEMDGREYEVSRRNHGWDINEMMMSYIDAIIDFKESILPFVVKEYEMGGERDSVARSEAWSNYVDSLVRSGDITRHQADNWDTPGYCD